MPRTKSAPFSIALISALFMLLMTACSSGHLQLSLSTDPQLPRLSGTAYYDSVKRMNWKEREAVALPQLLNGNMPSFLFRFVAIHTTVTDSSTGKQHHITYYVSPDVVSIGTNDDWARLPLTPMSAQALADTLHCILPTRKMVNDIYQQAVVKLPPVPLYAYRDSSVIMYHHHLIIEGQRKGRKGLIAGIKKDVVISGKLIRSEKKDRVAIYGWHQLNGQPIQPLYTGHVNWWVDYSHGIRLVYRTMRVDGKQMDVADVMQDPVLQKSLCDEPYCDVLRYQD